MFGDLLEPIRFRKVFRMAKKVDAFGQDLSNLGSAVQNIVRATNDLIAFFKREHKTPPTGD